MADVQLNTLGADIETALTARSTGQRGAFMEAMLDGAADTQLEDGQLRLLATTLTTPAAGGVKFGSNASGKPTWMAPDGVAREFHMPQAPASVKPPSGGYVRFSTGGGNTGTAAGVANQIRLAPAPVMPFDITYSGFVINVTAAVASANAKIVIYGSDPLTNQPTALLYESGNLDCSTTGNKTATQTLTLRAGLTYWYGVRSSSTATLTSPPNPMPIAGRASTSGGSDSVCLRTVTFATASPDPWAFVGSEVGQFDVPHLVWGIAA